MKVFGLLNVRHSSRETCALLRFLEEVIMVRVITRNGTYDYVRVCDLDYHVGTGYVIAVA